MQWVYRFSLTLTGLPPEAVPASRLALCSTSGLGNEAARGVGFVVVSTNATRHRMEGGSVYL